MAATITHQRGLLVLFGSETGCAQQVAEGIARESRKLYLDPEVMSMDAYDRSLLPFETRPIVFVASTTGQGVTPANMKTFWRLLLVKSLPANALEHVRFTVFGLGDSSYHIYNAVARRLHQRLKNLGATPFCERGLGDDQHRLGYFGALQPWLERLWEGLLVLYPLPEGKNRLVFAQGKAPPSAYCITPVTDEHHTVTLPAREGTTGAVVLSVDRLTADDYEEQIVCHVRLQPNEAMVYEAGDALSVYPRNPLAQTLAFLTDTLKLDPDLLLTITSPPVADTTTTTYRYSVRQPLAGCTMTLRTLFVEYLDVWGVPGQFFFEACACFSSSPLEREKLLEFASPQGQEERYRYCDKERRSYAEIFMEFPSIQTMPLSYIMELVPFIQPRLYSLASSPIAHAGELHLAIAVLAFQTPLGRQRHGLCSTWLSKLPVGAQVTVSIHKGGFNLPTVGADRTPLVFVGPGTGIAPFRSMLHSLHAHAALRGRDDVALFCGCRYEAKDFIYANEWREQLPVPHLFCAFSRDQENKVYVQDRMREQAALLFELLFLRGGFLFVAGNAKLPEAIQDCLRKHILPMGNLTEEETAQAFKLFLTKRYKVEAWS